MSKKVKAPTYRDVYEKAYGPIPPKCVVRYGCKVQINNTDASTGRGKDIEVV